MKNTKISLTVTVISILCALFLGSCALLPSIIPGGGANTGNFSAVVTQVTGSAGTQDLTVVVTITNRGPNARRYVGGSLSGTMAVDIGGNTIKPYSSTGVDVDLPTGVPVKVSIARFGPILPGTAMLRTLRVSIGSSNEILEFRNVPIAW